MPLNKPVRDELNWDTKLNAALDYLDNKVGATGATGATGPTGSTGPTGPTGPSGFANIVGGSASSVYTNNQSINGGTAGSF